MMQTNCQSQYFPIGIVLANFVADCWKYGST